MKSLLILTASLVLSVVIVPFLPLPTPAIQGLVGMLGANALMAIVFALMANGLDTKE